MADQKKQTQQGILIEYKNLRKQTRKGLIRQGDQMPQFVSKGLVAVRILNDDLTPYLNDQNKWAIYLKRADSFTQIGFQD